MAEIKSLSIRHEAILEFLMANPTVRLQDVATHFGVTGPWLSQVIHSDVFQVRLKERSDLSFHDTVLSIKDKMMTVAHQALDKLSEELPKLTDVRTAHDVAEGMLDRLGFGAKPINAGSMTINQQNNLIVPNANAEEIARARALLAARSSSLGVTLNGHGVPIALPRECAAEACEALLPAEVSTSEGEYSSGEGGDQVRAKGAFEAI